MITDNRSSNNPQRLEEVYSVRNSEIKGRKEKEERRGARRHGRKGIGLGNYGLLAIPLTLGIRIHLRDALHTVCACGAELNLLHFKLTVFFCISASLHLSMWDRQGSTPGIKLLGHFTPVRSHHRVPGPRDSSKNRPE
jgi:hypothetical protein